MPRNCDVLRVFTRHGEGGNHLGVVTDIDGLTTAAMQAIAAELGFSETVFIERTEAAPPYVRIFTPGQELPFAGHPLVGTAWTMLTGGEQVHSLRCGIGDVAVGIEGEVVWVRAAVDAANARRDDRRGYAQRAGLPVPQRSWLVAIPKDYVILEYGDVSTVAGAAPEAPVLAEQFGTMLFARDGDRVRARFFAPDAGVFEDPATGSAAVALATAFVAEGETTGSVLIDQGEEMGHPSRIELSWTSTTAQIGGTCVRDEVRRLDG